MPKLGLIPYKLLCEIIGLNKLEFPSYPVMKATSSDVYLSGLTSNLWRMHGAAVTKTRYAMLLRVKTVGDLIK